MSGPRINRIVADFVSEATGNQKIRLKELRGKNVVVYFYPKDSTPGCTQEGRDFSELHAKFRRQNTVIFGVSRDSLASHEKFKAKQGFKFELLSDPDEKLCKQFDVIHETTLYGRKFMGCGAEHLPDRRRRQTPRGVAQGQGQRACAGSPRGC